MVKTRNFGWNHSVVRSLLWFFALLFWVGLQVGQGPARAAEPPVPRTLRVVMDNNYPPYTFFDTQGRLQGILADQWRLWQARTGIRVELSAMDWKDALAGMRAGEFDVIDTVFKTEERARWLEYGKPYTRIEVSAFFSNEISGITDIDSLKGFVVAVKEGDAAIDLLRSRGVDNLVLFKGYEAIVQAAKERKVNVLVIDKPPALYFLHKYGIQQQYHVSPPFHVGSFHRAVAKGNSALLKEIEDGFAGIAPGALARIEEKWCGAPLFSLVSLRYLLGAAVLLGLLILALFFWNRALRKAVVKRTIALETRDRELRASEARYRELVESANSIILRMDGSGRISFINEYAQRFFGYSRAELIGRSAVGTIVPETDSAGNDLRAMIADIGMRPDHYATNENENMRRDGSRVWISWTNRPFFAPTGEVSEVLCIGHDSTDRRRATEALRRERELLSLVIEGSQLGTWEWNIQSNETVFNETWAELIGYTLAELTPCSYQTWEQLLHPDDLARARETLHRCVDGHTPDYDCEFRMQHRDGHWVWILVRGRVLARDSQGKPLLMFGTHTDITKRKAVEEELQATNKLFSLFIQHSPIYAFIKEVSATESRTLNASDNFIDMIGIPGSAMVGKTMAELFPAEFAAKISADDWAVVSRGETLHLAEDLDGRNYITIKFPLVMGDRHLLAGYSIDITEQKRAEQALRESEERFASAFEYAPIGIALMSPTGQWLKVNRAVCGLLGYSAEELVAKTFQDLTHPDDLATDLAAAEQVLTGTVATYQLEKRYFHKQGRVIWALLSVSSVRDQVGRPRLFIAQMVDISERKRMEEELRRREHQLQKILEILPIGLWFADRNGVLLRGNPMGVQIWGGESRVPPAEYGIFKAWRLPSREPVGPDESALAKTIRDGVTIVDELLEIETFDGKRKTILNYSAPVFDDGGNIDGAIVVNLDISDRKALESQLLQAQKMESIGRLAGGVAHDFNNMLSVILGHAELALHTLDAQHPLATSLQHIRDAAQRSADLTQQLLAFARRQTVTPKVLDLNQTLAGMLRMLKRLIGEDIDLAWLPGEDPGLVKMDPSQVDQILVNLLVNARDAIGETGKVTIETGMAVFDQAFCARHAGSIEGDYVLLAVSDDGCGMDAETLAHLFEPFYTTKKTGKGTGLGLATVYGIVRQNNGFINVYSEPGQGTTFKIYLPRHTAKAEWTAKAVAAEPSTRGHETILLVEDEPLILDIAKAMLESLGYTVLPAVTPGEALALAREHAGELHLLLTDVIMPEMNGRDLARNLLSLYPNLARLFMSGYTANVIAHHGVLDEGVYFIQKPFSLAALAAMVRQALNASDTDHAGGRG